MSIYNNLIHKYRYIFLFLIILLFLFIEVIFIKLPIHPNFEIDPDTGLAGLQARSIGTDKTDYPVAYRVVFLNRVFPIMVLERHGALELYLSFPFLVWFGNNIEALRIAGIFWGVVIIIITYSFVSNFFNIEAGILTILLLVINSNFINFIRWWNVFGFTMPIFTLTPLLLLRRYFKTKKRLFFYFAMFVLGIGINVKGWFLWFIIAFFISITIHWKYCKVKIKTILIGLLFLFLGFLPIVYFNFKYRGFLTDFVWHNLYITEGGVNNLSWIRNLLVRIDHLKMLMNQDIYTYGYFDFLKNFPFIFFILTMIWLFYLIMTQKKYTFPKRRIILILSITILTFIFSTFTFTTFYPGHLYILFPYLEIVMVIGIFEIIRFLKYRIFKILFSLLVGMLFIAEIGKCSASYFSYKNIMEINKGSTNYDIADWILDNKRDETLIWCDYVWPSYLFFLYYDDIKL